MDFYWCCRLARLCDSGNIFFLKRRVPLQRGVQRTAIQADAAVLEYNPRIINTWTVEFIRRIRGCRTFL